MTPAPIDATVLSSPQEAQSGDAPLSQHAPGGCGCGQADARVLELDVRAIPHVIRHSTVFAAFDAIPADGALVLVAPHDPLPLLRQLGERSGGTLGVTYLDRGPEAWRLRLTR